MNTKAESHHPTPKVLRIVGEEAIQKKGYWRTYRYLFLRRFTQVLILICFAFPINDWFIFNGLLANKITSPVSTAQNVSIDTLNTEDRLSTRSDEIWVLKGSLANSELLHTVPLGDPFIFLQSLSSGHIYTLSGIIGVLLITLFYFFLGGRTYCAFVCPVNIITDAASWIRTQLRFKNHLSIPKKSRVFLMVLVILVSMITQSIAWELINPITGLFRAIVYGGFSITNIGVMICAIIFLLDTIASGNLWCGHLCPVGAFYGMLGKKTPLKIKAVALEACDDCLDCYKVCPEQHVLRPVIKEKTMYLENKLDLYINHSDCTRCGRCIDICPENVFDYRWTLNTKHLKENTLKQ